MKDFFAENVIDWKTVENYQQEGTVSGYCMALAECDKLLNFLLDQDNFFGNSTVERVKKARDRFANVDEILKAIETKENVFEKYEEAVSVKELKDAIRIYKDSINDFVQGQVKESSGWEKFTSSVSFYFLSRPGFFKNFLIGFASFIILVLVLDATHFGQKVISWLANIFKGIVPVLTIIGIVIGIVLVLYIGAQVYFDRKKQEKKGGAKKIKTEDKIKKIMKPKEEESK